MRAHWTGNSSVIKSPSFETLADWYKCLTNNKGRENAKIACGKKNNLFNINHINA
jgi:hypothetical protein